LMKAQTIKVLSLAMALSNIPARAQDPGHIQGANWDANGVDASIHAGVDEHRQAQPLQKVGNGPTTSSGSYSHWVLGSISESPTTRFWPTQVSISTPIAIPSDDESPSTLNTLSFRAGAEPPASTDRPFHATNATIAPEREGVSAKFEWQPNPFHILAMVRTQKGSTGSQRLKTIVPPLSPRPHTDGFAVPFLENQFSLTSDSSSLPRAFSKTNFSSRRDGAAASRRESHPKKSRDRNHTGAIVGFHNNQERASRSRLTTKAK
jgi:hypothetical protein